MLFFEIIFLSFRKPIKNSHLPRNPFFSAVFIENVLHVSVIASVVANKVLNHCLKFKSSSRFIIFRMQLCNNFKTMWLRVGILRDRDFAYRARSKIPRTHFF